MQCVIVPFFEYSKSLMIRKGSPNFFPQNQALQGKRSNVLCSCGCLANLFFPFGSSVSPNPNWASGVQNRALCGPSLRFISRCMKLKLWNTLSQVVAFAKALQFFSETHLRVMSKTGVDSLWWICSLQWTPQWLSQAYIPSLTRNMMHRLCNRHCVQSSQSSRLKNVSSRQSCSIYMYINEDA